MTSSNKDGACRGGLLIFSSTGVYGDEILTDKNQALTNKYGYNALQ